MLIPLQVNPDLFYFRVFCRLVMAQSVFFLEFENKCKKRAPHEHRFNISAQPKTVKQPQSTLEPNSLSD